MSDKWARASIPSQTGRTAVVTGATGGLGYETALALAQAGAEVIVAGRNLEKGKEAIGRILAAHPEAKARFELLDLASLKSVEELATRLTAQLGGLDILVNNAGVMALKKRQVTPDGFELQLGTNYLGHFALTSRLLPLLRRGKSPRVVSLSSIAHRNGALHFDDLQLDKSYGAWRAYGQSKLAMLMFALELQRRSDKGGWGVMSNAAHPGWSRTDLVTNGPRSGFFAGIAKLTAPMFGQSAAEGALPTLFAATANDAKGGEYYGPSGVGEITGSPSIARISKRASDGAAAAQLWEESNRLTHVAWDAGGAS